MTASSVYALSASRTAAFFWLARPLRHVNDSFVTNVALVARRRRFNADDITLQLSCGF